MGLYITYAFIFLDAFSLDPVWSKRGRGMDGDTTLDYFFFPPFLQSFPLHN
jgi:hypothetical protein